MQILNINYILVHLSKSGLLIKSFTVRKKDFSTRNFSKNNAKLNNK